MHGKKTSIDCAAGWKVKSSNLDRGVGFFFSPELPEWLWSPHNFLLSRYRCSFSGLKRLEHEPD